MADQAKMSQAYEPQWNGGSRVHVNAPLIEGVVGNIAEFGHDLTTLAELQAKLAVHDMQESARKVAVPAVVLAVATVLILSSVPVVLIGIAWLIAPLLKSSFGLVNPQGWALVIVALVTMLLAGILALFFGSRASHSFESFQRSREELTRNLNWIKTVLTHSGRYTTKRR